MLMRPKHPGIEAASNEGEGPADSNISGLEDLAAFREKGGCIEDPHQDVVIDDFDTNVAVRRRRNDATNDSKHVACNLRPTGRNALVNNP